MRSNKKLVALVLGLVMLIGSLNIPLIAHANEEIVEQPLVQETEVQDTTDIKDVEDKEIDVDENIGENVVLPDEDKPVEGEVETGEVEKLKLEEFKMSVISEIELWHLEKISEINALEISELDKDALISELENKISDAMIAVELAELEEEIISIKNELMEEKPLARVYADEELPVGTKQVKTFQELKAAVDDKETSEIIVMNDIKFNGEIYIGLFSKTPNTITIKGDTEDVTLKPGDEITDEQLFSISHSMNVNFENLVLDGKEKVTQIFIDQTGMMPDKGHVSTNLSLDNVKIINGFGKRAAVNYHAGVGVLNISDSTFENNKNTSTDTSKNFSDGGAIYYHAYDNGGNGDNLGTIIINNSTFDNNSVVNGAGGAVYAKAFSGRSVEQNLHGINLTVNNSKFLNNKSKDYGTIHFYGAGNLKVTKSTIKGNITKGASPNTTQGGIISTYSQGKDAINVIIDSSEFSANESSAYGTVNLHGGGDVSIKNSTFDGNSASDGGAIHMQSDAINRYKTVIENNSFTNNEVIGFGGAIRYHGTGELEILNSKFNDNKTTAENGMGGAISINEARHRDNNPDDNKGITAKLTDNQFISNISVNGGALSVVDHVNLTIDGDTLFRGNSADKGGAFHSITSLKEVNSGDVWFINRDPSTTLIEGVKFIENESVNSGKSKGGAIYLYNELESPTTINNSKFDNNNSKSGGAISIDLTYQTTINGSTFNGNTANSGGGIHLDGVSEYPATVDLIINQTEFNNNIGNWYGGGVYNSAPKSEMEISYTKFNGNETNQFGGGICISNSGSDADKLASTTINNSEFKGNIAGLLGGGINVLSPSDGTNITEDNQDNKNYFNKLKVSDTIFEDNLAKYGFFYLDEDVYKNIQPVYNSNIKNVGPLSGDKTIYYPTGNRLNKAYNNYDISFIYGLVVVYDGNGNTGGTAPEDANNPYEKDTTVTILDKSDLVKDNSKFLGWALDKDAKVPDYKPNETFVIEKNTILYAVWDKEPEDPQIPWWVITGGEGMLNKEDHFAYIVGYPDGTVRPEGEITRGEVATIFFRMMTESAREKFWSQENTYSDVMLTDWYNNAISTLSKTGAITGYPEGDFKPNASITRGEFAAMASRFLADYGSLTNYKFTDIKGNWAESAIEKLASHGLINGYPDGSFKPNQVITRAEAATLVNAILERTPHKDKLLKDMIKWPDNANEGIWYYAQIQEATNSHEYERANKLYRETWTKLLKVRDWVALEKEWSNANSSSNPGEVTK